MQFIEKDFKVRNIDCYLWIMISLKIWIEFLLVRVVYPLKPPNMHYILMHSSSKAIKFIVALTSIHEEHTSSITVIARALVVS